MTATLLPSHAAPALRQLAQRLGIAGREATFGRGLPGQPLPGRVFARVQHHGRAGGHAEAKDMFVVVRHTWRIAVPPDRIDLVAVDGLPIAEQDVYKRQASAWPRSCSARRACTCLLYTSACDGSSVAVMKPLQSTLLPPYTGIGGLRVATYNIHKGVRCLLYTSRCV